MICTKHGTFEIYVLPQYEMFPPAIPAEDVKGEHNIIMDVHRKFPTYLPAREITAEGYLEKHGGWNQSWKSRYFVLDTRGRMYYFKNQADSDFPERARRGIPITKDVLVSRGGVAEDGRLLIRINLPGEGGRAGRTLMLGTWYHEDHQLWLSALEETRQVVLYVAFPRNIRHW
jgi:hypothetical protein